MMKCLLGPNAYRIIIQRQSCLSLSTRKTRLTSNQNLSEIISIFNILILLTRLLRNSDDELRFSSHSTLHSMSKDIESFIEGSVWNISIS